MVPPESGLFTDADGTTRCWWAGEDPLYQRYHDREWGFPVRDDQRLFEKLCLEGFQAGLAWITILRKREHFRRAFRRFDIDAVARLNQRSTTRLLADPGIVRHRGKIESTMNNARRAREVIASHGSLAAYFWSFEPSPQDRPRKLTGRVVRTLTQSTESKALSRDLKKRGFTFVGPTTGYAFMQAMGLVNDHVEGCHTRASVEAARQRFRRPRVRRSVPAEGAGQA